MTFFTVLICVAAWYWNVPPWACACAVALYKLLTLLPDTFRDFLAAMNLARVEGGGRVAIQPARMSVDPRVAVLVKYWLYPLAMVDNFFAMHLIAARLLTVPRYKTERGITLLLKRVVSEGGWRAQWAHDFATRWLDDYDPTGRHV